MPRLVENPPWQGCASHCAAPRVPPGARLATLRTSGPPTGEETCAMTTEIVICPDGDQLAARAADHLIAAAGEAIRARGRFTLALSGGSTPEKMYGLLARPGRPTRLDGPRLFLSFGDARSVPHDAPRTNSHMPPRSLLSKPPTAPDNVFPTPAPGTTPPAESAAAYTKTLAGFF